MISQRFFSDFLKIKLPSLIPMIKLKKKSHIAALGSAVLGITAVCIYFLQNSALPLQSNQTASPIKAIATKNENARNNKTDSLVNTETNTKESQPGSDADITNNDPKCLSYEDLEQIDQHWQASTGSAYDADGYLSAEHQYLDNLSSQQIKDLANQGYAQAMMQLSTRLLYSDNPEDITKGRQWAYQAAVHGVVTSLSSLAVSYLTEYEVLNVSDEAKDSISSVKALLNYQSTLKLLEHIAPGATSGIPSAPELEPITASQNQKLEQQTNRLISDFDSKREQLGLEKLRIDTLNGFEITELSVCQNQGSSVVKNTHEDPQHKKGEIN